MEIKDSSLFYKAASGEIDAFKQLDSKQLKQLVTPFDKNAILHIHITTRTASVNFVKEVLRICPDLLHQQNEKKETLLHIAARYGHKDILKSLVDYYQKDQEAVRPMLREVNEVKDSALHEAARYGHLEVVKELIKRDSDYSYDVNDAGESPLYLAAKKGPSKVVDEILKIAGNSPAYYQGPGERTALHAAVRQNDEGMTNAILGKMTFLATKADQQGWVPLHYAAKFGYLPIVKRLLDADNSAAYIGDKIDRKTPLHVAAENDKGHIVKELISRCPGCWEMRDAKGRNVFHYAAVGIAFGSKLRTMFRGGGLGFTMGIILRDPLLRNLINEKDDDGKTPLHLLDTSDELQLPLFLGPFNPRKPNPLDVFSSPDDLSYQRIADREKSEVKENNKASSEAIDDIQAIKDTREAHLVVATLIATVSFAAAFTMPGGYRSNENDPEKGHALLAKEVAFQAFVVSNSIALMFSSTAVLLHLFMAFDSRPKMLIHEIKFALVSILYAMIAMMVAFITGTYAVLSNCLGLAIVVTILCSFYLLPFAYIFVEYFLILFPPSTITESIARNI